MSSSLIQLLVLAGIALFLILRLRDVLGTREGFEKPVVPRQDNRRLDRSNLEVIEGGPDRDILDHAEEGSAPARWRLAAMKTNEPGFNVGEFLGGARGAYEMILMGFEAGEMSKIQPFLSEEVYETFASVVEAREAQGLSVEANFVGVRELKLEEATRSTPRPAKAKSP